MKPRRKIASPYTYVTSPIDQYRLSRDGKTLLEGTEQEIWAYLHRTHSYSVSHALQYEGFWIDPLPRPSEAES